ncbi:MAG TPA: inositol monophosphatase family protein [Gemmataceae bacterium]|nr:inositol monophosphatase family protein [Gemmataceae bacterium]
MMNSAWRTRYEAAVDAAGKAAQLALRYFDIDVAVEWKEDDSPVTVADRQAEQLLRDSLLGTFPDDGFLGEEYGDKPGTSGYRWIVDPVDGTRSFVRGIPVWGTLVGLQSQGELIAGIVIAPALRQTWRALRGDGAYRGERRIRVSDVSELSKATVFYTNLSWFERAGKTKQFLQLAAQTQNQRGYGDFWGHMLVAQGAGEIMADHGLHVWDIAAIQPIVEEAGGRFSAWDGRPDIHRPDVLASNGKLHEAALHILQS